MCWLNLLPLTIVSNWNVECKALKREGEASSFHHFSLCAWFHKVKCMNSSEIQIKQPYLKFIFSKDAK